MHPSLDEPSMVWYLLKTYLFNLRRPSPIPALAEKEHAAPPVDIGSRQQRLARAEETAAA